MKITIDTKEDSHEEIKKVISMLQNLVGKDSRTNVFEDTSPKEGLFEMFNSKENNDKEKTETEIQEKPITSTDANDILKQVEKEKPKIESY